MAIALAMSSVTAGRICRRARIWKLHDFTSDLTCGVKESLLSSCTPRVVIVSDVLTVAPATLTPATGSVNRARWEVQNCMVSDLSGLRARPLRQNQACKSVRQLSKVEID